MASCVKLLNTRPLLHLFFFSIVLVLGVMYFQDVGVMDTYSLVESLLDRQNYSVTADKWIIIDLADTLSDSTRHVHIPGWRLLMLGYSGRKLMRCDNCIHFSTHRATKVRGLFPTNTTRPISCVKAQAVLYVINSGAEWIFWSNGVDDLQEEINRFKLTPGQTGLIYKGGGLMDPLTHFTTVETWSRELSNVYILSNWPLPIIQTIWRPNINANISEKDIDYHAPPIIIPRLTFHENCLKGSLFHRKAFWSLVPLMTTNHNRSPILSFWVQRLIWEFDGVFAFLPPVRNTKYTLSTQMTETKETEFHLNALNVIRSKLSNWKCHADKSFHVCGKELAEIVTQWGNFTQGELSTINDWLSLLHSVLPKRKADEDKRKHVTKDNSDSVLSAFNAKESNLLGKSRRVVFNARTCRSTKTFKNETNLKSSLMTNPFISVCRRSRSQLVGVSVPTKRPLDDILLIIIFNKPGFLVNIKYLFYMYGRYFTHILICGDSLDEFAKLLLIKHKVSFIEINIQPGFYGYQCMMEAMQMGYGVKGYLQISDDVLLNVWSIVDLPRHRVWFQSSMRSGNLSSDLVPDIDTSIHWWGWRPGRLTLIQVWKDFSVLLKDQNVSAKIQTFLDTLELNAGRKNSAFYEASDIYYIPARLKDLYVFYSSWFLKHRVFLEIAIPTVINGLVLQKNVEHLPGSYLWNNRNQYREKYNPRHAFLHPYKLHVHLKHILGVRFLCEKYLPEINSHLMKLGSNHVN